MFQLILFSSIYRLNTIN
ncbi:hypothetical protein D046_6849A, partial [Vibrio parahaemolyticus V-223/04]